MSNHSIKTEVGDLGWSNMVLEDAERFRSAFARTATLHERNVLEISSLNGLPYRIWMWSIGNPDLAVCTFNLLLPKEIENLSLPEREQLVLLAQGKALKEVATELDLSINRIHSHMRNVKSKLGLDSPNEVVSYAGRFFHQTAELLPGDSQVPRSNS